MDRTRRQTNKTFQTKLFDYQKTWMNITPNINRLDETFDNALSTLKVFNINSKTSLLETQKIKRQTLLKLHPDKNRGNSKLVFQKTNDAFSIFISWIYLRDYVELKKKITNKLSYFQRIKYSFDGLLFDKNEILKELDQSFTNYYNKLSSQEKIKIMEDIRILKRNAKITGAVVTGIFAKNLYKKYNKSKEIKQDIIKPKAIKSKAIKSKAIKSKK